MDQNVHVQYVFTLYELDHICNHHNAFLMTCCCTSNSLFALFLSLYLILHISLHIYLSIQYDYRYGLMANG